MTQSWSHKLFLRINAQVGKRPWLDSFMFFCAHWLILYMVVGVLALSTMNEQTILQFFSLGLFALLAFGLSWLTAYLWKHPRPIVEFPSITQLLTPTQTIKSFPSDHALLSWMIAFFVLLYPTSFFTTPYVQGALVVAAALVSIGRVYVGVHYPRDILGGFGYALVMSLIMRRVVALFI